MGWFIFIGSLCYRAHPVVYGKKKGINRTNFSNKKPENTTVTNHGLFTSHSSWASVGEQSFCLTPVHIHSYSVFTLSVVYAFFITFAVRIWGRRWWVCIKWDMKEGFRLILLIINYAVVANPLNNICRTGLSGRVATETAYLISLECQCVSMCVWGKCEIREEMYSCIERV